ncbi:MAG: sugar transferase [Kiritimatiellae bacterium]|nr:sugar transferase [Kiritimatiellia bacterium]
MPTSRTHLRLQITWLAMMDLACLVVGAVIGVGLRFGADEIVEYVFQNLNGWFLLFGCVIFANYLAGSYRIQYTFSRFNLFVTWAFSLMFALLMISIFSYTWFHMVLGRGVLALTIGMYSFLALSLKLVVYRSLFRSDMVLCRTVIIGTGARAQAIRKTLEDAYILPAHKVIAFINLDREGDEGPHAGGFIDGAAVVGTSLGGFSEIVRSLGVALLVVALDDLSEVPLLYPHLKRLRFEGIEVLMPLDMAEIYAGKTPLDLVNEEEMMHASLECRLPMYRRLKRFVDVGIALVASIILAPLGLLVVAVIKLAEPGSPIFYHQKRVGLFGHIFSILKFRTMRADAETESGAVWSMDGDPRITPVGRFLRASRLDELPQLINVLRGEMSLVGPRPERPEFVEQLSAEIPWYDERENILPGITGWAQIRYPYGSSVEDTRRKLEYDLFYMKFMSISLDLQIILRTLRIMLLGKERRL